MLRFLTAVAFSILATFSAIGQTTSETAPSAAIAHPSAGATSETAFFERMKKSLEKRGYSVTLQFSEYGVRRLVLTRGTTSATFTVDEKGRILAVKGSDANSPDTLFHWKDDAEGTKLGLSLRKPDGRIVSPVVRAPKVGAAGGIERAKTISPDGDDDEDIAWAIWGALEIDFYNEYWAWSTQLPPSCDLGNCLTDCAWQYAANMLGCGGIGAIGTVFAGAIGAAVGLA